MAHPQSQAPSRAFSPPQHSPSPAAQQPGFALPPNKRVRTDGPVSQPGSPYAVSSYAMSPGAAGSPPLNAGSPTFSPMGPSSSGFNMPYVNGNHTTTLNLPDPRAGVNASPQLITPVPQPMAATATTMQYTNSTMAPIPQALASPAPTSNVMGPPQRPADRPTKDYEYDVTDSLAGTGIDLRAEEQYMSELYSNAMDANPEARTGFAQLPPGGKTSFYGAGPANKPAEAVTEVDQKKFAQQAAEKAWADASMRLAVQRVQEIKDPFLSVANLHRRAEKIARDNGIGLNLEMRNNAPSAGRMRMAEQFPTPQVTVQMQPGPDSTMVKTTGSLIPHDAFLVDQLALLSIATKQRLREMLEDANVVAAQRQKTSHGEVPEDWSAAAAPMNADPVGVTSGKDSNMDLDDGAVVAAPSETAPLKRSADAAALGSSATKPPKKMAKIASYVTATMRELARQEREWEESRLRRRQMRKDGVTDGGSTSSRAGSVAPGTPGSVAPESEKPLTKKEIRKQQTMKAAEANSHANQNMTSSMFAGLGGKGNLFGKKKTGKTYDWLNAGRGGSGTSTPTRSTPGLPGARGLNGASDGASPGNPALTTEGRNRLGTWREDKEKGKNIQLRDWIVVLERDGREVRALQDAYVRLDASNPK